MSQPLLEIRNTTKIYRGGFLRPGQQLIALQDFNLTILETPATITAIAGESGSGKTTLANLILGFISPTSGEILYRGQNTSTPLALPGRRLRSDPGWYQNTAGAVVG